MIDKVKNKIKSQDIISKYTKSRFNIEYMVTELGLDRDESDTEFLSTNRMVLLMYIIFRKKYKIKMKSLNNSFAVVVPKCGVYYRILDSKTVALARIYRHINEDSDIYSATHFRYINVNINIIGINAPSWARRFENECTGVTKRYTETIAAKKKLVPFDFNDKYEQAKDIDEIIMNIDDKNNIIKKIDIFLQSRDFYYKNKIKYKLGIMFYGEPGTGKSELAKAIALYYHKRVYAKSKTNIAYIVKRGYDDLSELRNSICLLEEIDSLFDKNPILLDDSESVILGRDDVLSFIDMIPETCIIIGTTNHFDKLDKAFIRPGRFDIKLEMKLFDKEQAIQMCDLYHIDQSFADQYEYPLSPVQLQFDIIQEKYRSIIQ